MYLIKFYRFICFLSLDIVLGVTACSMLACKVLTIYPPLSYKFLLPLAVWALYLVDHLIDGYRHANNVHAKRYKIYYEKRRSLIALISGQILFALLVLIFSFDSVTFQFGLLTGIIILCYFIFEQLRFRGKIPAFPKEPMIAVVYTLGIWGVPLLISKEVFDANLIIIMLSFAMIVLMNVQLYSIIQLNEDKLSGYHSLADAFGVQFVYALNLTCGVIVALLNLYIILWPTSEIFRNASIILLIMDISLIFLSISSRFNCSEEFLGVMADATFYVPFIIMFFRG
jgi:hypothetical protein